jgi:pyridoxine 5-phosphate synthase
MKRLSVNIDHVATVREARQAREPDPVLAAQLALLGGAHGITLHLRGDRRHVQDHDFRRLKEQIRAPITLEMGIDDSLIALAVAVRPAAVTLVPERPDEVTTEGGIDLVRSKEVVREACRALRQGVERVCLFLDPDPEQLELAAETGADSVELHSGRYADAESSASRDEELRRLIDGARLVTARGLQANVGHGLDYLNVVPLVSVPEIHEFSIGHSIVARAIYVGVQQAVRDMVALLGG